MIIDSVTQYKLYIYYFRITLKRKVKYTMANYFVIERNDKFFRKQHLVVHTEDSVGQAKMMTRRTTDDFVTHECIVKPVDQLNGLKVVGFILLHKETYKPLCGRHAKGVPFLGGDYDPPRGYYTPNGAVTGAMRYMKTINPDRMNVGHEFIVHGLVAIDKNGDPIPLEHITAPSDHPEQTGHPAVSGEDMSGPAPLHPMASVILNSSPPKGDTDPGDRRFAVFTPNPAPVSNLPPLPGVE